jgi:long-chain acyl-CoA synthetase
MSMALDAPAMERIWLASYPPGVPAEIRLDDPGTLRGLIEGSCERFAPLPAFTCMGRTLSYARIDTLSRDFASWLQNGAGLRKGTRVALMMPNLLQYPVALFGALRAGLVVVNCNPLYKPRELEHQLVDSGAEAIVILENFARTLQEVVARTSVRHVVTTQVGDLLGLPKSLLVNAVVKRVKRLVPAWSLPGSVTFGAALAQGARRPLSEPALASGDLAFLQYTGGTTGVSKGAMLTHGNIVANLEQVRAWTGAGLEDGKEVVITALPLYHIFALTGGCFLNLKIGAHNVLITNPIDMQGNVK